MGDPPGRLESTMDAKVRFYALAVSTVLVMAAGAMTSNDAMAQSDDVAADDVTVQSAEAPVETDEVAAQADDIAVQAEDVAAQDEALDQPVPQQKPAAAKRPVKSDLDQSAVVRATPVIRSPRPTRTSTVTLPKILGSYR